MISTRLNLIKKRAEVKDDSAAQILANMQTIADILKKPEQNRNIADFERNGDHEQTGTAEVKDNMIISSELR